MYFKVDFNRLYKTNVIMQIVQNCQYNVCVQSDDSCKTSFTAERVGV